MRVASSSCLTVTVFFSLATYVLSFSPLGQLRRVPCEQIIDLSQLRSSAVATDASTTSTGDVKTSFGNAQAPFRNPQVALKLSNPHKVRRIARHKSRTRNKKGENAAGDSVNERSATVGTPSASNATRVVGARTRPPMNEFPGRSERKIDDSGDNDAPAPAPAKAMRRKLPSTKRDDRRGPSRSRESNRRTSPIQFDLSKQGRAAVILGRRGSLKKRDRAMDRKARVAAAAQRNTVSLPRGEMTVAGLSESLDAKPVEVIKFLMSDLGVLASMTNKLDWATCVAVVEGFGKVVGPPIGGGAKVPHDTEDTHGKNSCESDLHPRAPVVTVMGHVDHGKTSLLDAIRNTHVTRGEAGGITQHIAAYQVGFGGDKITFVDTPGHAAFTDMRQRGANITDIVVLVIAADDGVKQQTIDSIACARQAGVPLVVAINKCDLSTADPTRVMTDLTAHDVITEDLGGEVLLSQISAKEGQNLDDLLEKVMLQAELQDLKADPSGDVEATVVEAKVEKGVGTVATVLVNSGTLRAGTTFVAGETHGRIRALVDTTDGKTRMKEAGPSMPVRVIGFDGVPAAGDLLVAVEDEQTARTLCEHRRRISRERQSLAYQNNLMNSVSATFGSSKQRRELCVLVKADVQGSAEALTKALSELRMENDEAIVSVKVLVSAAGEVSKSDISLAAVTPETTVLAFNCASSLAAMEEARQKNIPIHYFDIVYDAIASVESRMQEVLSPTPDGEYVGSAAVQQVFTIGGIGNIAGCKCQDGVLRRGGNVRVLRGDKILVERKIKSLRNFKSEVDSIEAGNDCGVGLVDYEEFEPGDIIECYIE